MIVYGSGRIHYNLVVENSHRELTVVTGQTQAQSQNRVWEYIRSIYKRHQEYSNNVHTAIFHIPILLQPWDHQQILVTPCQCLKRSRAV